MIEFVKAFAPIAIAFIGVLPAILAAYWARQAKVQSTANASTLQQVVTAQRGVE